MKEYTVSQLNTYIKNVLDDEYVLNNIQLVGEVVDCKISKGHTFFVMTDGVSNIECVQWGAVHAYAKGACLSTVGAVRYYSKQGQVRFVANTIVQVDNVGLKQLAYLQLKTRLEQQGLIPNKLELPARIQRIALVTSREGAVIHDFVSVVRSMSVLTDILVYSVRVQGEDSPAEISQALYAINNMLHKPDVIVLARGGGSSSDLDAFNNEITVLAVANSAIPVVSAIGHESDYTLCDLCASARAGTPSIAAQMVTTNDNVLLQQVMTLTSNIGDLVDNNFAKSYSNVSRLLQRVCHATDSNINQLYNKIQTSINDISHLTHKIFDSNALVLEQLSMQLHHNNPTKILAQGYARLRNNQLAIQSIRDVRIEDSIRVDLRDGSFEATVTRIGDI
ncbi:MAG: exodeoxyribonuclease VII large subunit [Clostridiales bacterium]|jgi:exodeoxyribonuclease VII large subunit|nr:exodeoxyribonuclease VII large subunit [Clostridiales bacterium]